MDEEQKWNFSDPDEHQFSIEEQDIEDSDDEINPQLAIETDEIVPKTPMKWNNSMPDITALPSHMTNYRKDASEDSDDS